jgi:hypothetical protein
MIELQHQGRSARPGGGKRAVVLRGSAAAFFVEGEPLLAYRAPVDRRVEHRRHLPVVFVSSLPSRGGCPLIEIKASKGNP